MGLDVTVVVATFGDEAWANLARLRAIPSAEKHRVPVVHSHADTLHGARNLGLEDVRTPWVCFLDADDQLDPRYFDRMAEGTADVRAPAVRYVVQGIPQRPYVPRVCGHHHACSAECLPFGNWVVIGAAARTDLVREAGGFRDFPWSEDWDLWLRCHLAGATFEAIPNAVYRAYVRPDSRNRGPDRAAKLAAHQAIARANNVPVPA